MAASLDQLLVRIRDGEATADEVARAELLLRADERIPPDLRAVLFSDDPVGDAGALLAILGHDDGFGAALAAAIQAESAGIPELSAAEVAELEAPFAIALAEAVRELAGPVDVASAVEAAVADIPDEWLSALLDAELSPGRQRLVTAALAQNPARRAELTDLAEVGRQVRSGIHEEGGAAPWLWAEVAQEIGISDPEEVPGWSEVPLRAAIAEAGGPVPAVWPAIEGEVRRLSRLAAPAGTSNVVEPPRIPEPANQARWWVRGLVMVAAAALVSIGVWRWPAGQISTATSEEAQMLVFAGVEESQVVDLNYDSDVNVMQLEGDQGALILWVDEEKP
jgi:hypothetical protein